MKQPEAERVHRTRMRTLTHSGLRTALEENDLIYNRCEYHAMMATGRGFKYCPHCGKKLEQVVSCTTCRKSFFSEETFFAHLSLHKPHCPKCGTFNSLTKPPLGVFFVGASINRKGFRRFHCPKCNICFAANAVTGNIVILEIDFKKSGQVVL